MLVKYISCYVKADKKNGFSNAQLQWDALKHVPGFIRQFGGWLETHENDHQAVIVALWETEETYEHFMAEIHDQIFFSNHQSLTYQSINVSLEKHKDVSWVYNKQINPEVMFIEKRHQNEIVHSKWRLYLNSKILHFEDRCLRQYPEAIKLEKKWSILKQVD